MKILNVLALFLISIFSVYILIVGKSIIFPIVMSVLIWYLINVFADLYAHINIKGIRLPKKLCFVYSIS